MSDNAALCSHPVGSECPWEFLCAPAAHPQPSHSQNNLALGWFPEEKMAKNSWAAAENKAWQGEWHFGAAQSLPCFIWADVFYFCAYFFQLKNSGFVWDKAL